ncbi:MAG: ATP-binding domain-containing protein, partial [Clostridia bacterium]|nr:ATP-binding domain-containing protein [Clostridia bacterium]
FDSQEVRDAMAYLRVINNPGDGVSLRRIINVPRRAIGDTTMDNAAEIAEGLGISLYEVLQNADSYPAISRAAGKIREFLLLIDGLREMNDDPDVPLDALYEAMLTRTGYLAMWQSAGEEEQGRVENLSELASSIKDYERNSPEDIPSLSGFLEEAALMTDVDNYDRSADTAVLMTMHAAKGLEFPVVFLPGLEDGVFPGMASIYDPTEMEEERRLCYVGITRAREELYLTNARCRMLYGQTTRNAPSRFLQDIPDQLLEVQEKQPAGFDGAFGDGFAYGGHGGGYASRYRRGEREQVSVTKTTAFPAEKPAVRSFSGGFGESFGTTAAKPAVRSAATASENWKPGDQVEHGTFGAGEITAVKPMGNDSLLTVQFQSVGVKKIMANFAKLKRRDAE